MRSKPRYVSILGSFVIVASILFACTQSGESGKIRIIKKDPPSEGAVAKIFGEVVKEDELEEGNSDVFQAKLKLYETKKQQVEAMVRDRTFKKLADQKKMSVEEFLEKEQEKAKKSVSKKEVEDFLVGKVRDPKNVDDRTRDYVKGIIYMEKLVTNYSQNNPVELYLKRPRAKPIDFNFQGAAVWGKDSAPITVVEYSDFQCPYCANAAKDVIAKLKKKYGQNQVRVVFKHFPLEQIHPDAKMASVASMCVHEQSPAKFWTFHDIVFENQRNLKEEDLLGYAKKAGADEAKYKECMEKGEMAKVVEADIAEARRIGVNSTPTFYINSQPILGARSIEDFAEIIAEETEIAKNN